MTTVQSRLFCALVVAAALSAALGLVASQRPDLVRAAPWAFGDRPAGPQTQLLCAGDAAAEANFRAKREVIQRLIEGRQTLLEAAAWFRALHRPLSDGRDPLDFYDGKSEGERTCRMVIAWGKAQAELQSPSQAEVVGRRLEAELTACLARDGDVRLPDVE
jgi:hypothetical protein